MKMVVWWCVLLLLLYCATVSVSQSCTEEGAIEVIGINMPDFVAGRLEICAGGFWRAVYDTSWEQREAQLVCREKGLTQLVFSCTGSCFGASTLTRGYTDFNTCFSAARLINCGRASDDGPLPNDNAGVICSNRVTPECTTDCSECPTPSPRLPIDTATTPCPASDPAPMPPQTPCNCSSCCTANQSPMLEGRGTDTPTTMGMEAGQGQDMVVMVSGARQSCTAVGAALGMVSALLLLALVGVITGWVWSCHRCKLPSAKERDTDNMLDNPTYTLTPPTTAAATTVPAIKYSSLGPSDTPILGRAPNTCQTQWEEEAEYQEVGGGADGGGGSAYEIPIESLAKARQS